MIWSFEVWPLVPILLNTQNVLLLVPFCGHPSHLTLFKVHLLSMVNYHSYTVGTFHSPCRFENQMMPREGGPENVTNLGDLTPINPKFDSSKDKTWKLFEGWYYLIAPIPSHHVQKSCTSSCPWCLYLTPKNAKAWILRLYCTFGYQKHPLKNVSF